MCCVDLIVRRWLVVNIGCKHSENNSDNRSETWKHEQAKKGFLATIESVNEKPNIRHMIWSAETCKKTYAGTETWDLIKKSLLLSLSNVF